jgi:hypothetical protein
MEAFLKRVREIVALPLPLKEGAGCQLQPRALSLSPAAEELYIQFYNEVETRQGNDGDLAEITGTASKMPEQALRLAATFQSFTDMGSATVSEVSLEAGIHCARYYLSEALRVDQDGGRDLKLDCAAKVLNYIRKSERDPFTMTRIRQYGPTCARKSSKSTRDLLDILVRHGYLQIRRDAKSKVVTYLPHPRLWGEKG